MKGLKVFLVVLLMSALIAFASNVVAVGPDSQDSDADVFRDSESSINSFVDNFGIDLGDVNYDGYIDVRDLVRLKRYIGGIELDIDTVCANVDDGDSSIDLEDLSGLSDILLRD